MFHGPIIDNVAMLFCLVTFVYVLLQQGKFVSYMTRRLLEAYAITDGDGSGTNDYGKEVLAVRIKMMEDYKDRIVVIFAGYKDKMETFVDTNPGMKSRIGYTFDIHDYSDAELVEIFCRKANKAGFVFEKGVKEKIGECVKGVSSQKDFGNGRHIDKLFQEVMVEHTMNLNGNQNLKILSVKDIPLVKRL